jgi:hypothetical protein
MGVRPERLKEVMNLILAGDTLKNVIYLIKAQT